MLSFSGLGGPQSQLPEGLWFTFNTNLNTLSIQTPRGQKLSGYHGYIKEEWQLAKQNNGRVFLHR